MKPSIVKRKLAQGTPVLAGKVNFESPAIVELMGLLGFDCVWVCNEHLYPDDSRLAHMVCASRAAGMDFLLRRTMGGYHDLLQPLEMGVHGLMIPRVTDPAYLERVVSMVKFPPDGSRGLDGVNADADFGLLPLPDYVRRANDQTFIVAQIEEPAALERLDEIASVVGVDVLLVGPGDLSLQLGAPGKLNDPRVLKALDGVAAACRKYGKHAGTTTSDAQNARTLLDRGYMFLGTGVDYSAVKNNLLRIRETFGPLGFTFAATEERL